MSTENVDLRNLIGRILLRDPSVADDLDKLAEQLKTLANKLRQQGSSTPGTRDPGGMSDRVQISVVGPDGTVKQKVDTQ